MLKATIKPIRLRIPGTDPFVPIIYQNSSWALIPRNVPIRPSIKRAWCRVLSVHQGVVELLPIVDITINGKYTEALMIFFDNQGITMTRVPNARIASAVAP
jgi:hypothetical protein